MRTVALVTDSRQPDLSQSDRLLVEPLLAGGSRRRQRRGIKWSRGYSWIWPSRWARCALRRQSRG